MKAVLLHDFLPERDLNPPTPASSRPQSLLEISTLSFNKARFLSKRHCRRPLPKLMNISIISNVGDSPNSLLVNKQSRLLQGHVPVLMQPRNILFFVFS